MSDASRTSLQLAALLALRPPDLAFDLPLTRDLVVGCGLKQAANACCRYSHHPSCEGAVVRSIVTVSYTAYQSDAPDAPIVRDLVPYVHQGDLLLDWGPLMAVVRTQHATIEASVDAWSTQVGCVICVREIRVSVWCLTRDESARIDEAWEALPAPEASLALEYLDPCDAEAFLELSEHADFLPVVAYPAGATILPGEVGRDRHARYLSEVVIDGPDPVDREVIKEATVHVVLADGTETDVGVRAVYTGPGDEPLKMSFHTLSPRTTVSG